MANFPGSPLRPRWVYTDSSGAVDYLMSVPQRPWGFGSRGVGGSDISAAGVPASYEIRRDHLLHLTLRFPESEWDDVERLVRHLQLAGSATLYPDQDDTSVLHLVYGESPALGEEILPRRSAFPSVLELDVTVRRTTDAIFVDPYFGDLLFHWQAGTRADGMVFTRSGTAYYVDKDGQLATVATDVERTEWVDLDGDGIFGTPTLLLEDARTNLLLRSEDITTTWGNITSNDTANVATAPDGTTTADKFFDDSTEASTHILHQTVAKAASSLDYAFTVYVKAVEYSKFQLRLSEATVAHGVKATFDLTAEAAGAVASFGSGWTAGSSRITPLANGWYRCEMTGTSDTTTSIRSLIFLDNGTGTTYNGDGASGVYVWGLQLEQAAFASSYIKTAGSTVTRNAETCYFDFPFDPREMTVYAELIERGSIGSVGETRILHIGSATSTADPRLTIHLATTDYRVQHDNATTTVTSTLAAAPSIGDTNELRAVLAANGSVQLHQSVNSAAETSAVATAANALGSAWAATRIYPNSAGASLRGFNAFRSIKIARGTKTMEQMRVMSS